MIVEMVKIRILGPKSLLSDVTGLLHSLAVVHIESLPIDFIKKERYLKRLTLEDEDVRKKALFERIREDIKHVILLLPEHKAAAISEGPELLWFLTSDDFLRDVIALVKDVGAKAEALVSNKKGYQDELALLKKYEDILNALAPLILQIKESKGLDYIGVTIKKKEEKAISYIKDAAGKLTENRFEIFTTPIDEETLACLLVLNKEDAAKVKGMLWEENISELKLPATVADRPLIDAIKYLINRGRELTKDIDKVNNELKELSIQWYQRFNAYKTALDDAISQIVTTAYFYETKFTFAIYGWVPKTDLGNIRKKLNEKFQKDVLLEELEIQEKDAELIPVFLKNPKLIKPFELFMSILPLPKYGTIDPTPFIAIFFPIFFGSIVGDVAYGIIILIAAIIVRYKYKERQFLFNLSQIFIISSIYTIFFGFIYGEFLGELGEHFGLRPICIDRKHAIIPLLFLSMSVGAAHIFLGLILGIITSLRLGHKRESVAKLSKLFIVAVVILLLGVYTKVVPQLLYTPSVIALAIAFPVLVISGGLLAPLELFKVFGNILSYVRLMAFGLASIFLAYVASALSGITGNIVLGIFIAALFHLFNILLSLLSPTIQSIRLQYVEFFGKFFVPGGRRYTPFKRGE
ncbi:MAG: V-type ATPase 116kDa subunit family protein [Nitrospirota bacterium]|mgnify:FL=1